MSLSAIDVLVCSEPGKLAVERRSAPSPAAAEVLVRPRRIGVCGTDYHILQGKHPFLQYPRVMGHELAVEIVEAPAGSAHAVGDICVVNPYLSCGRCIACRAGNPNCCVNISVLGVHQDGGMAELLSVPTENLVRADGLTVDECATVEFLAIGAHAIRRAAVTSRDTVLVVGTGPIGLGVALFARAAGAPVTVFDRDAERASAAKTIAEVSIIPSDANIASAVGALTGGDGFTVVVDATGNQGAMEQGFDLVAHGGRYVLVSVIKDSITFMDPDFHRKEMTLFGSRNATNEDFARVIAAIRSGDVPVDRIITHRTSLAGAVHDIPVWAIQKTGLIKALIEID
jgi:2-desacetyl-2-hydroxyethyl bacteriochlorophyllide A dehydrogenase